MRMETGMRPIAIAVPFVLAAALALAGCGRSADAIEVKFVSYANGRLQVDCSKEVNKGKRNVDDIGYLCDVRITESTRFSSESGTGSVTADGLKPPSPLRIKLTKPAKLSAKPASRLSGLAAEEVVLLNR